MKTVFESLQKLFRALDRVAQIWLAAGMVVLAFVVVASITGLLFLIALNPIAGALLLSFITGLVALFIGGVKQK